MPSAQPYQPFTAPSTVTKPGIWRIAAGVWLGLILFFVPMIIIAIALGSLVGNEFRTTFDNNRNNGTSSSDDPFDFITL